jgi:hypothetical protein
MFLWIVTIVKNCGLSPAKNIPSPGNLGERAPFARLRKNFLFWRRHVFSVRPKEWDPSVTMSIREKPIVPRLIGRGDGMVTPWRGVRCLPV